MSSEDQKPPKEEGKKVESKPDVPESAKLDPKKVCVCTCVFKKKQIMSVC